MGSVGDELAMPGQRKVVYCVLCIEVRRIDLERRNPFSSQVLLKLVLMY